MINGKTYIGQHRYKDLNDDYMGSGTRLRAAQAKYGIENFKKEILVFNVSKKEHIDLLEKTFITSEREKVGIENCYNIANGGEGFSGYHPEETRRKMRVNHKGMKGKHHSEESKRKVSEAQIGKPKSEEQKRKISETLKGRKRYTNGIVEIFIKGECPEGFWPGRIGWKKES